MQRTPGYLSAIIFPFFFLAMCCSLSLRAQVPSERVWATYYGGTGNDGGGAIAKDAWGHIYMAGGTTSVSGIATVGTFMPAYTGTGDAYLAKFDTSGALIWATYFNGNNNTGAYSTATDISGNIYITGQTWSTLGIATPGAWQAAYADTGDCFLAKFDSTGNLIWATYYGGIGTEYGKCVATDLHGNVFITGSTKSTSGIATAGAYQGTHGAGYNEDAFLAKFDSAGVIQWATYYGGEGDDEGYGLVTDDTGNVFVTGYTSSASGIATPGAWQDTFGGDHDIFLAKFNGTGTLEWATYLGGSGYDIGQCIARDSYGGVYIAGGTRSVSGLATPGAWQAVYGGGALDAFIAKFNNSGMLQWATYYGDSSTDLAQGIAIDAGGNITVAGTTGSHTGMASGCAYQPAYGGGPYDALIAKFDSAGILKWSTYYGGTGDDGAVGIAVGSANCIYIAGGANSTTGIATSGSHQDTLAGSYDAFLAKFQIPVMPNAGTITGPDTACLSGHIVLADTITGGIWRTSNTSASITDSMVSGLITGADTIFYIVTTVCGSDTAQHPVTIVTCPNEVKPMSTAATSAVFPNPNNGTFTLYVAATTNDPTRITITNVQGQVVKQLTGAANNPIDINIDVPAGLYFVNAITRDGTYRTKVVVEK